MCIRDRARTARAAFGYAGQSCVSVQRVFVERGVFQTFLWKVVEATAKLVVEMCIRDRL